MERRQYSKKPAERREPAKILEVIKEGAVEVKDAAAELTATIQHYENYLAHIPGRVYAACFGKHPDDLDADNKCSLFLQFCKQGSEWKIMWSKVIDVLDDFETTMKPLVDAPLTVKIAAVDMFPDLIESIENNQRELINQVKEANARLEKYIKTLPVKEGN